MSNYFPNEVVTIDDRDPPWINEVVTIDDRDPPWINEVVTIDDRDPPWINDKIKNLIQTEKRLCKNYL